MESCLHVLALSLMHGCTLTYPDLRRSQGMTPMGGRSSMGASQATMPAQAWYPSFSVHRWPIGCRLCRTLPWTGYSQYDYRQQSTYGERNVEYGSGFNEGHREGRPRDHGASDPAGLLSCTPANLSMGM